LILALLLFFPRLFGFKKAQVPHVIIQKRKLPSWFWIGLVLWGVVMIFFYAKLSGPKWLANWALIPLWWGFILMLDGIVYKRNDGKSLVHNAPAELFAMGILSISGWLLFEYFNFFIDLNWYYPAAGKMNNHDSFLLYAVLGSSAFIPMAFEWYHLLRSFPVMNVRYSLGKKIEYSKKTRTILLFVAFALLFFMAIVPNSLFYAVWLGPLSILVLVLGMLDIWTPFKSIKERGDWTSLLVLAPVWVLQGLCVEWWNYLSYQHHQFVPTSNPGYWEYCIPYVNFGHIFNMPVLGFLGYVPFSLYCLIYTIIMSHLMNIKLPYSFDKKYQ
jgi:hypothetical protein